MNRKRFH